VSKGEGLYAAVLAGGKGERFWPVSLRSYPKQFLSVFGDKPMLRETLDRIRDLVPASRKLIMTGDHLISLVGETVKEIPGENILGEPIPKNTAPAIALAALVVDVRDPGATMIVLPADHLIRDKESFVKDLLKAAEVARAESRLVTFGVLPNRPETEYGYVRIGAPLGSYGDVYEAAGFREKPNLKQAGQLLADGSHLWNSGLFVWTTTSILGAFEKYLPSLRRELESVRPAVDTPGFKDAVNRFFASAQKISIDYGVMEKADNVVVVKASFDWDDVGSWLSMERLQERDERGNVARGGVLNVNTENTITVCEDGLVATLGVSNLLIVRTGSTTLVCRKDRVGEVGKLVEEIGRDEDLKKFL
jgi:mannose-1-phosphate guanylyltransferase